MMPRLPIILRDIGYILLFIVFTYFVIDVIETKTSNTAMRKIVANCLSDSVGKPVVIGNEVYLCGIVNTGERI